MIIERRSIRQTLSYGEILKLQETEFAKRVDYRKDGLSLPGDVVFFVEHRPVYTLGKHGNPMHLLKLKEGIEYATTSRGGDITYHGPGQLTVYPIIDLQRYRLGVKEYVHLLEECVIRTIATYGLQADRIEGLTGVWLGKGTKDERKISAIGIKCSRFITMHGFAFNIGPDINNFGGIVPCGLKQGVTSLSIELGCEISIDEVEEKLWKNLISLLLPRIPSQGNF